MNQQPATMTTHKQDHLHCQIPSTPPENSSTHRPNDDRIAPEDNNLDIHQTRSSTGSPRTDQKPEAIGCSPAPLGKTTRSSTGFPRTDQKPEAIGCSPAPLSQTTSEMRIQKPAMEESGRERLKRHRVEMAGRVWVPDIWGQEELLKDWIDCNAFNPSLANSSIMSARAALVEEGRTRTANSGLLRMGNRC